MSADTRLHAQHPGESPVAILLTGKIGWSVFP